MEEEKEDEKEEDMEEEKEEEKETGKKCSKKCSCLDTRRSGQVRDGGERRRWRRRGGEDGGRGGWKTWRRRWSRRRQACGGEGEEGDENVLLFCLDAPLGQMYDTAAEWMMEEEEAKRLEGGCREEMEALIKTAIMVRCTCVDTRLWEAPAGRRVRSTSGIGVAADAQS